MALSKSPLDLIMAVFFVLFVFISVSTEAPVCMGEEVLPSSEQFFVRNSYYWGLEADMLWIVQPVWVRAAVCMHAFGFAPCYALLAFVFATGQMGRYSTLVIAVAITKLYAGALYMTGNLLDPQYPPAKPYLFVLQSCSYMLIPFLALVRASLYQLRNQNLWQRFIAQSKKKLQ
eukprot:TRINITY_DN22198_c0_g1_i1.p1 TRINITY_DN22198_c0_g1~~TRINITY_DN22198_c0_g1_i1.p1  ORF type:complete len:174 (+),score=40.42 TRINITY_DN22198_c0_g1_i1:121-642(+)